MSVREYIGARYIPLFMGEWDNTKTYEPLSIVQTEGNSYTSRQYVPTGIDITNEQYWAESGNYNSQIEQYRQEVLTFNSRISTLENDLPTSEFSSENTVDARFDTIENALPLSEFSSENTVDARFDAIEANNWVTTDRINNSAVTTDKINNSAVTTGKIADSAVTYAKINDGAIAVSKLNPDVIKRFWAPSISVNGTNMVVLGDSYTQDNITNSVNAYWPKRVATALGCNLFNYAIAGAGFGRATQLISVQQTNCQNDMTSDQKQNTSIVLCYAGCNDLLNDVSQANITSGITGFISWASSQFPYAQIYVIPFNWGFSKLTTAYNAKIINTMNTMMVFNSPRVHVIPYAWLWNLGIAGRFQNEVHPNQSGYNTIAAHILNAITGSNDTLGFSTGNTASLSGVTGLNSGVYSYSVINGVVCVTGYIRPTSAGSQNITIYSNNGAPAIITPNDSFIQIPLIDSTNHKYVGHLAIIKDGRMIAYFNSDVEANDVCCFETSYRAEVGVSWSDYN